MAASQSEFAVTRGGTVLGNVPMALDASGIPQAISASSPMPITGTLSVTPPANQVVTVSGVPSVTVTNLPSTQPVSIASSVAVTGANGTATVLSGTIATGGTSQQIAAALTTRSHVSIKNPAVATETLCYEFNNTASLTTSYCLQPGEAVAYDAPAFVPTGTINVIATTTGHLFKAEQF